MFKDYNDDISGDNIHLNDAFLIIKDFAHKSIATSIFLGLHQVAQNNDES